MADVRLLHLRPGDRFRLPRDGSEWVVFSTVSDGSIRCNSGQFIKAMDQYTIVSPVWPERIHLTPETVVATSNRLATDPRRWRVCDRSSPRHFLGQGRVGDPALAAVMSGPGAVLAILNLLGSTDWWGSDDPITWSDLFLEEVP